jgi:hypothetical protein
MLYATEMDIIRCQGIVKEKLQKKNISCKDNRVIKDITIDIMNISYSKGGDYSNLVIETFTESYIERKMYERFFN